MENNQPNGRRYARLEKLFSLILTFAMLFNMFGGILPSAYAVDEEQQQIVVTGDGELNIIDNNSEEKSEEIIEKEEPVEEPVEEPEDELEEPLTAEKPEIEPDTVITAEQALRNAINNASSGATVMLESDVDLSDVLEINKNITLDLNGYMLKYGGSNCNPVIKIVSGFTVTITDSKAADASTTRYWTPTGTYGSWQLQSEFDTTGKTEGTDYFTTVGGVITGGRGVQESENWGDDQDPWYVYKYYGGGIYNDGTLNINAGNVVGNYVLYDAEGQGGGIYNSCDGTLNISGTAVISGNGSGEHGGGVYNDGTMTVSGGEISGNISDSYGGGVYNSRTMTVTGGEISGNTATNSGGGIYNASDTLTMSDGKICNNRVIDGSSGGVYGHGGNINISGGEISGNTAKNGGGMLIWYATVKLTGGKITGNHATENGGGICYEKGALQIGGKPVVTGNTSGSENIASDLHFYGDDKTVSFLTDADAPDAGIQIGVRLKNDGKGVFSDTIQGAAASGFFANDSALVVVKNSSNKLEVTDFILVGEGQTYTTVTAALADHPTCGVKLTGNVSDNVTVASDTVVTIDLNGYMLKAGVSGSVIINNGTLTVIDSNPTDASTARYWVPHVSTGDTDTVPAGLWELQASEPTSGTEGKDYFKTLGGVITGGTGSDNIQGGISGGGIQNCGTATLTDCTVVGNSANERGGGIYNCSAILIMTDCTVAGNVVKGNYGGMGGGIANQGVVGDPGDIIMTGCTVTGNAAYGQGGGIRNEMQVKLTMTDCIVTGNTAPLAGGIDSDSAYVLTIIDCTVTGNTADDHGGGIKVNLPSKEIRLGGSTVIKDNIALSGGEHADNLYLTWTNWFGTVVYAPIVSFATGADAPTEDMDIGVTVNYFGDLAVKPEGFTVPDSAEYFDNFTSDDDYYGVYITDNNELALGHFVATVTTSAGDKDYLQIGDAFTAANTASDESNQVTVKLLDDCTTDATLAVESGKNIKLDLNGYEIKYVGNDNNSVITNSGTLTIIDSNPTDASTARYWVPHVSTGDTDTVPAGLWELQASEPTSGTEGKDYFKTLGGVITGGTGTGPALNCSFGGGIYNGGSLTINAGNIVGNTAQDGGGGIQNIGSNVRTAELTVNGGYIAGNTAQDGGGIYNADTCVFTLTGGEISYNTAHYCAGVFQSDGSMTMTGGKIVNNTTSDVGGGIEYGYGTLTLGGDAVIKDNISNKGGEHADNLYLPNGKTISFATGADAPTEDMYVGVSMEIPGIFTKANANAASYLKCFNADTSGYYIAKTADNKLELKNGDGADSVVIGADGSTVTCAITSAFDAANTGSTVRLLKDITVSKPIIIPASTVFTLDLNGCEINGNSSPYAIDTLGTLTVTDSRFGDESCARYWEPDANGRWTELAEQPSIGTEGKDYFKTLGGVITGASRALFNEYSLTLEAGNIVGNSNTNTSGCGIYSVSSAVETVIKGGRISGNYAKKLGAGVHVACDTFTMTGGEISHNSAGKCGGGIFLGECTAEITGGKITDNVCGMYAGGVDYLTIASLSLGGDVVIKNNISTDGGEHADNLYIEDTNTVTVFTGDDSPTEDMYVGVSMETTGFFTGNSAGIGSEYAKYFGSDVSGYEVISCGNSGVNQLALAKLVELTNTDIFTVESVLESNTDSVVLFRAMSNYNKTVKIPAGEKAVLDLNGYRFTAPNGLYSIEVKSGAELTVIDSRADDESTKHIWVPNGSGKPWIINDSYTVKDTDKEYYDYAYTTGGSLTAIEVFYGAVYVDNGKLTIENANICGSIGSVGGALTLMGSDPVVVVENIKVIGNCTDGSTGGATTVQAAVGNFNGMLTIKSGIIAGNSSIGKDSAKGGGLFTDTAGYDAYTKLGNVSIINNSVTSDTEVIGGGMAFRGTVTLNGKVVIENNTANGVANDIESFGFGNSTLDIVALNGGSKIGVAYSGNTVKYFTGANTVNYKSMFFPDDDVNIITRCTEAGNSNLNKIGIVPATVVKFDGKTAKYESLAEAWAAVTAENDTEYVTTSDKQAEIITAVDSVLTSSLTNTVDYIVLDLNGHEIKYVGSGNNSVITNNGTLTINDSKFGDAKYTRYWVPNTDGLWVEQSSKPSGTEGTDYFTTKGGVITGGTGTYVGSVIRGGGIYNTKTLVINDANVIGNNVIGNTASSFGGGIANFGAEAVMTINDGYIAGNTSKEGGGLFNGIYASLTLNGGKITRNKASTFGGGIISSGKLVMTDGEISYNYAGKAGGGIEQSNEIAISGGKIVNNTSASDGGGIDFFYGTLTLGGTAVIENNKSTNTSEHTENIYLHSGKTVTLGTSTDGTDGNKVKKLESGAKIGITVGTTDGTGIFTDVNATDYSEYFFTDNDALLAYYEDTNTAAAGYRKIAVVVPFVVKFDGKSEKYGTIEKAFKEANAKSSTSDKITEITLGSDSKITDKLTINEGKFITLDLNGCEIKYVGIDRIPVIINNGTLTINDSKFGDAKYTRYWTPTGTYSVWVETDEATATANSAVLDKDYFVTKGGVITGGKSYYYGGGIDNEGTLTVTGGNIVGNYTAPLTLSCGGGIYDTDKGKLTITGGYIAGNFADEEGGGVYAKGDTDISNCVIAYNETRRTGGTYGGGGIIIYSGTLTVTDCEIVGNKTMYGGGINNESTLIITNSKITGNTADVNGGGIFNAGTAKVSDCEITGNKASGCGGISTGNGMILGGKIVITGNTNNNNVESNLRIFSGKVSFGTKTGEEATQLGNGVPVLATDSDIGVTLASGTGVFTNAANSKEDIIAYSKLFHADDTPDKMVDWTSANELELVPAGGYYKIGESGTSTRFYKLSDILDDLNDGTITTTKEAPINISMTSDVVSDAPLIIGEENNSALNGTLFVNLDLNGRKVYNTKTADDSTAIVNFGTLSIYNTNTSNKSDIYAYYCAVMNSGTAKIGKNLNLTAIEQTVQSTGSLNITEAENTVITGVVPLTVVSGTADIGDGVTVRTLRSSGADWVEALYVMGGTVNITGGTFDTRVHGNRTGLQATAAVWVEDGTVNISGGKFNADLGGTIVNYGIYSTGGTANVTGGSFKVDNTASNSKTVKHNGTGSVILSGGYYNLNDVLDTYKATGTLVLDSDKATADGGYPYTIGIKGVEAGGKEFITLSDALTYAPTEAPANQTPYEVKLVKDIEEDAYINAGNNVKLDLNGKIIKNEDIEETINVYSGGKLSIVDTSNRSRKTYIVYDETDGWQIMDSTFDPTTGLTGLTENKDYVIVNGGMVLNVGSAYKTGQNSSVYSKGELSVNGASIVAVHTGKQRDVSTAIMDFGSKFSSTDSDLIALGGYGLVRVLQENDSAAETSVTGGRMIAIEHGAIDTTNSYAQSIIKGTTVKLTVKDAKIIVYSKNNNSIGVTGLDGTINFTGNTDIYTASDGTGSGLMIDAFLTNGSGAVINVASGNYVGGILEMGGNVILAGGWYDTDPTGYEKNNDKADGYSNVYYKDNPVYKYQVLPKGVKPVLGSDIALNVMNVLEYDDALFELTSEEVTVTLPKTGDVSAIEYTIRRISTTTKAASDKVKFIVLPEVKGVYTSVIDTMNGSVKTDTEIDTCYLNTDMEYSTDAGAHWTKVAADGNEEIADYDNLIIRYIGKTDYTVMSLRSAVKIVNTETQVGLTPKQEEQLREIIEETLEKLEKSKTFNGDEGVTADQNIQDRLGADGYIKVEFLKTDTVILSDAESTAIATEFIFDVTPIDENGDEVHSIPGGVRFRLPVPKDAEFIYANIYHEGVMLSQVTVQTDEQTGDKYVEVTGYQFSQYSYKLTNTKYFHANPKTGGKAFETNGNAMIIVSMLAFATILAAGFYMRKRAK